MPHILVEGSDLNKNIESLSVHAHVKFSYDYYTSPKAAAKLKELQEKMEKLIDEYFPNDYESEIMTNHEWNVNIKNF